MPGCRAAAPIHLAASFRVRPRVAQGPRHFTDRVGDVIGMKFQQIQKFELGKKGRHDAVTHEKGTGLGLPIVRGLCPAG